MRRRSIGPGYKLHARRPVAAGGLRPGEAGAGVHSARTAILGRAG